jgi:hypothetical protein
MRALWLFMLLPFIGGCRDAEQSLRFEHVTVEKMTSDSNVVIVAPKELIHGGVVIDGKQRRPLWPDTLLDHPRWWFFRNLIGLKPSAPSAAKENLELAPGHHELRIEHEGYMAIVKQIEVKKELMTVEVQRSELMRTK